MDTPICNFINKYIKDTHARFHVPGHKGKSVLGFEKRDITEVYGADELYGACGIIAESEKYAGEVFGAHTFYSCEGSSLCIRAMLFLAANKKSRPLFIASRNAHKTFINTAALLGADIKWLYPKKSDTHFSFSADPADIETAISDSAVPPCAVYITSPDYIGNMSDIRAIAEVCHRRGVLLIVDNAHGAYLKFLSHSLHPIDLGADMCCDSAHKTLPVITGGAYMHISKNAPSYIKSYANEALSLFGSTSPSYLILQSLDMANPYLYGCHETFCDFAEKTGALKKKLSENGYCLCGSEPFKITIRTKPYGYTGAEISEILHEKGIVCEFYDPDFVVFMLSPQNDISELNALCRALLSIEKRPSITYFPPQAAKHEQILTPREAVFSEWETLPISQSAGRILAFCEVGCPPAVPIVCSGEKITEADTEIFEYYGIKKCCVIKQ